jgi:hypothetical protein
MTDKEVMMSAKDTHDTRDTHSTPSRERGETTANGKVNGRKQGRAQETRAIADGRGAELRDSAMMARLLDALEHGEDIGHYGRLTFAMVARFFMEGDRLVELLAKQPEQSETDARALVMQVERHDYSPPTRERILVWQREQEYQIAPDPDDPNSGNIYKELRFPDEVYEQIGEYYDEQAEAEEQRER